MRTRESAKRDALRNVDEAQSVLAQAPAADERTRKRVRRKDPTQPMRGGWGELPHNLGTIKLTWKATDAPAAKVSSVV